jgi:hypothetical protein
VLLRVSSLDQVAKLGRTQTTQVNEQTRRADLQRAAKKTTRKQRSSTYEAARAIPAQNRTLAAKQAKAAQSASGKKQVPVRGKGGKFDGSTVMTEPELALYRQALAKAQAPPAAVRWTGTRSPR